MSNFTIGLALGLFIGTAAGIVLAAILGGNE